MFVMAPLFAAFMLTRGIRGWKAFRSIYFLSYLMPGAMAGIMFSVLFDPAGAGILFLRKIGLGVFATPGSLTQPPRFGLSTQWCYGPGSVSVLLFM